MDGTGKLFDPFIDALAGRYAVIVVRYPTDRIAGYAELTELAAQSLPEEGDFVLLGESFSGPIAVALAAANPPGLIGLVLCCSFVKNPRPGLRPLAPLARMLPLAPGRAMSYFLLGRRSTPRLRGLLEVSVRQVAPEVMRARVQAVVHVDVSDKLKQVGVPVLYLGGTEDRVVPPSAAAAIGKVARTSLFAALAAPHCLLQAVPVEAERQISPIIDSWRRGRAVDQLRKDMS